MIRQFPMDEWRVAMDSQSPGEWSERSVIIEAPDNAGAAGVAATSSPRYSAKD